MAGQLPGHGKKSGAVYGETGAGRAFDLNALTSGAENRGGHDRYACSTRPATSSENRRQQAARRSKAAGLALVFHVGENPGEGPSRFMPFLSSD